MVQKLFLTPWVKQQAHCVSFIHIINTGFGYLQQNNFVSAAAAHLSM